MKIYPPFARSRCSSALGGVVLALVASWHALLAQDRRRTAANSPSSRRTSASLPARIEVMQDDLVKLTVRSEDIAHSFTIDEYRIVKRVPAGGSTTFEFRADRPGTFPFYCNLTGEAGHKMMHGDLVVRAK